MEEHNKKTLIEALSTLPDYEPNDEIWENIEDELGGIDAFIPIDAVLALPEHEPPAHLWASIVDQIGQKEKGRVVPIGWKRAMAMAASIALILFSVFLLKNQAPDSKDYTISYSTESLDPMLAKQDWDEDEEAFQQFHEICEAKKYICDQPAFRQLQTELEELTEAKDALKDAVGNYGADISLVTQMKEIELERTDLLKKMMVMLI